MTSLRNRVILVTDAHELAGLASLRSLGRAGVSTIACYPSDERRPIACWSRHCQRVLKCPNPWRDQWGFRAWLQDATARLSIDAVLPISEAAVIGVAAVRKALHPSCVPIVPSDDSLAFTLSKARATERAASLGIACPRTYWLDRGHSPADVVRLVEHMGYPLVLKTDNCLTPSGKYLRGQSVVVFDPPELQRTIASLQGLPVSAVIQEYIRGNGEGVFLLRHKGEVVLRFGHRRLHEVPYSGGYSTYRRGTYDAELQAMSETLLGGIDYEGAAMVEFRRDSDGRPYFLEINGRLWGSLALALHSGADFPRLLAIVALLGSPNSTFHAARYGLVCRSMFPGEVQHLISVLAPGRIREVMPPPSRIATIVRMLLLTLNPAVRHDHFWWMDPLPGIVQAARTLLSLMFEYDTVKPSAATDSGLALQSIKWS